VTAREAAADWVGVSHDDLSLGTAVAWASQPDCGALVTFCGCVRDHSAGRPGVTQLEYEAYEPYATERLARVARSARERYPGLGRIVQTLFHLAELHEHSATSSAPRRAQDGGARLSSINRYCVTDQPLQSL
jgi:molybdopterin synthase catalytic subunit